MFVQNYNFKYHYMNTENKSQKCNLIWFNLLKIRQIVSKSFLGVRNDMGYYFTRSREGEVWAFRINFTCGIEMSSTRDGDRHLISSSELTPHVPGQWSVAGQFVTLSPPPAYLWALTKSHGSRQTQTKENIRIRRENAVFNLHQRPHQVCFSH